jgi:uncharacterized membrane protein YqaE (UPF0057 family)
MAEGKEGLRDFWRVIAGYFIPPVGVFLQSGFGLPLLINCVLSCFFLIPGQLHAIWHIATTDEQGMTQENGTRTFVSLLLASWLPPVGVFLKKGFSVTLLINCVLCWALWIPGVIHGVYVITTDAD